MGIHGFQVCYLLSCTTLHESVSAQHLENHIDERIWKEWTFADQHHVFTGRCLPTKRIPFLKLHNVGGRFDVSIPSRSNDDFDNGSTWNLHEATRWAPTSYEWGSKLHFIADSNKPSLSTMTGCRRACRLDDYNGTFGCFMWKPDQSFASNIFWIGWLNLVVFGIPVFF